MKFGIIIDEMHPLVEVVAQDLAEKGHEVKFIDWRDIVLDFNKSVFSSFNVIYLDRMAESHNNYLAQLLSMQNLDGTCMVNNPNSYVNARNKILCGQLLKKNGVAVPNTLVFHSTESLKNYKFSNDKYVAKSAQGVCSDEVLAFKDGEIPFDEVGGWLERDGQALVQDFIFNPEMYIWRIDVVSLNIVVANKRYAYNEDKSLPICNGTHGGHIKFIDPEQVPSEIREIAMSTINVLKLDVAGIDIVIDSNGKPFVLEVNPEPDITLDRYEFPKAISNMMIVKAGCNDS